MKTQATGRSQTLPSHVEFFECVPKEKTVLTMATPAESAVSVPVIPVASVAVLPSFQAMMSDMMTDSVDRGHQAAALERGSGPSAQPPAVEPTRKRSCAEVAATLIDSTAGGTPAESRRPRADPDMQLPLPPAQLLTMLEAQQKSISETTAAVCAAAQAAVLMMSMMSAMISSVQCGAASATPGAGFVPPPGLPAPAVHKASPETVVKDEHMRPGPSLPGAVGMFKTSPQFCPRS